MENDLNETVLSISPIAEDHDALNDILRQRSSRNERWKLLTASTVEWATKLLRRNQIPVALCERDLQPGTWRDLLEPKLRMSHSPLVIVTSRLADERLWAEVLNEGGYDVLAKPFNADEVIRVLEAAIRHSQDSPLQSGTFSRTLTVAG